MENLTGISGPKVTHFEEKFTQTAFSFGIIEKN